MNSLFAELGLMDGPEKDTPPSHEMICLGVWINTLDMTLSVPSFRIEELQLDLNTVHPVSDDLRADIIWWSYFLSHYNGVSVVPSDVIISNPELFATDACLTGCGAVCFGECFHREFPDFILTQDRHINELELLTVVISIKLWAPKLQGLGVEFLSDNATCVSLINSQHSPNVFMQRCLRELWLLLAVYNIKLIVRSVRGCDNWLADSLSRFHTGKYCHQFKTAAVFSTE